MKNLLKNTLLTGSLIVAMVACTTQQPETPKAFKKVNVAESETVKQVEKVEEKTILFMTNGIPMVDTDSMAAYCGVNERCIKKHLIALFEEGFFKDTNELNVVAKAVMDIAIKQQERAAATRAMKQELEEGRDITPKTIGETIYLREPAKTDDLIVGQPALVSVTRLK